MYQENNVKQFLFSVITLWHLRTFPAFCLADLDIFLLLSGLDVSSCHFIIIGDFRMFTETSMSIVSYGNANNLGTSMKRWRWSSS